MMVLTLISLALSVIAILVAFGALYYARRQVKVMEDQEARREREDQSTTEWLAKFDEAVAAAVKIAPSYIYRSRSGAQTNAYGVVFPDPAFRQLMETHLIVRDRNRESYSPRVASVDQLRMPVVQRTIQEVLDRVKQFRESDPENTRKLGL